MTGWASAGFTPAEVRTLRAALRHFALGGPVEDYLTEPEFAALADKLAPIIPAPIDMETPSPPVDPDAADRAELALHDERQARP